MPAGNVREVRRRVKSVKNIQQITRAMKFVSASKLRRAQERVFAARPYADRMLAVLNSVATRAEEEVHPLLDRREGDRIMLVVITSDKGLAGAFNNNIIKSAVRFIEDEDANKTLSLTLIGRKGVDWFRRRPWPIQHQYVNVMGGVDYRQAQEIAHQIIEYYTESELD